VIFSSGSQAVNEFINFADDPISAASSSIGILLREMEYACENSFLALSRTSWGSVQQVTGPSAFVEDLCRSLEQVSETIIPLVESKKYLRNYFDKASRYAYSKDKLI
jgi:vacuolar protein sorting-associated protein 53